jgi:SAM-dependent methyltransferase
MKTQELENDLVKETVRERYGRISSQTGGGACGCAPTCCSADDETGTTERDANSTARELGYNPEQIESVPDGANLGLGCGNPQAIAALKPGETVLDLGSGAGFDAFIAARAVGPSGRVIGVDMTAAMITKARSHQARAGYSNVEFRLGEIEHLPVADGSVDVIISNCVINLSPDKSRVFHEAFRVLRPGGRIAISDVIALAPIPDPLRRDWELYTGCVAGAATREELLARLREAGFIQIRIEPKAGSREVIGQWFPGRGVEDYVASATIEAVKPLAR